MRFAVSITDLRRLADDRRADTRTNVGQAGPLAKLYAERVQTSGKAIGKTPQQISQEVAGARSDAMTRLSVNDTKRAAAERAEIAKAEEQCAALPFFEAFARHANVAAR